jgi:hypothetical protein
MTVPAGHKLLASDFLSFDSRISALEDEQSGELDYSEITSGSSAFTSIADITGLDVSFTLDSTRTVRIDVFCLVQSTIANDRIQLTLADSSNNVKQVTGDLFIPANSATVPGILSWRTSLAAGTYTYKVRGNRQTGTGTCIVNGGATRPCWIQALDVTLN